MAKQTEQSYKEKYDLTKKTIENLSGKKVDIVLGTSAEDTQANRQRKKKV